MAHKKVCEYLHKDHHHQKEHHLRCDDVTFVHIAIEYNQKDVRAFISSKPSVWYWKS